MQETKGHCKHGEFIIRDGCPLCIAERRADAEVNSPENIRKRIEAVQTNIVKVQYYSVTSGELSPREYTYYSADQLKVGDIVTIPVRDTTGKAKVSAIGVAEAEIASFKDKVKTIPAGSKIVGTAEHDAKEGEPVSIMAPDPNAWRTGNEELRPEQEEMEEGLNAEGLTLCGAEEAAAETAVVRIAPDKDEGYVQLLTETTKLFEYSTKLVIKGVDDKKAATNDLIIMGDLSKKIEVMKKEWLGPIDEHRKAVFDIFRQLSDPLAQAVRQTKAAMIEYDREQERIRLELEEIARKERELEEAKARAENRAPVEVQTVAIPEQGTGRTRSELGLASTVTTYKANVVDFKLLSDDYKMPDLAKLNRVVNAAKGKIEIPGVEVQQETNLRTRRQ